MILFQVTITLVLVSVQLLYTGAWLVLDPAGTRQHHPKGRRDIIVLKCQRRDESFLLSLVYIMLVGLVLWMSVWMSENAL